MDYKRINKMFLQWVRSSGHVNSPCELVFYPTYRCNLNCEMCFQKLQRNKYKEMSVGEIKKCFDGYKFKSIILVGGEIFVRKDIIDIIKFFSEITDVVSIHTNATIMKPEHISYILDNEKIKDIWISLDGLKNKNDEIRGKNVFNVVSDNIKLLNEKKNVHINSVILKKNCKELVPLYRYAQALGAASISFQFQMIYTEEEYINTKNKLTLEEQGFKRACVVESINFDYMEELEEQFKELRSIEEGTKVYISPNYFENNIGLYKNCTNEKMYCKDIIRGIIKVMPNGDVVACEAMNYIYGNIKTQRIEEFWNNEVNSKFRREMCNVENIDMCSRCCQVERIMNV